MSQFIDPKIDQVKFEVDDTGQVSAQFRDGSYVDNRQDIANLLLLALLRHMEQRL